VPLPSLIVGDYEREETELEIEGVGLPEDKTLLWVQSVQRYFSEDDDRPQGVVLIRAIDGAIAVELEMYPPDAERLGRALRAHAARARSLHQDGPFDPPADDDD
jgi:hypothetical protein